MKCSVELCPENGYGATGTCTWHKYREASIEKAAGHIREYLEYGVSEDDPRVLSQQVRIDRCKAELKLPKPTVARKSKCALMSTVRFAVDIFLQSPSVKTATDAKAAIDRYVDAQPRQPA